MHSSPSSFIIIISSRCTSFSGLGLETWGVSPQTVSRRPREFMRVSPFLKLRWGVKLLLKTCLPKTLRNLMKTLKLKMGGCLVWVISHVGEVQVNQPSIFWCVCQKVVILWGALTFWSRKKELELHLGNRILVDAATHHSCKCRWVCVSEDDMLYKCAYVLTKKFRWRRVKGDEEGSL